MINNTKRINKLYIFNYKRNAEHFMNFSQRNLKQNFIKRKRYFIDIYNHIIITWCQMICTNMLCMCYTDMGRSKELENILKKVKNDKKVYFFSGSAIAEKLQVVFLKKMITFSKEKIIYSDSYFNYNCDDNNECIKSSLGKSSLQINDATLGDVEELIYDYKKENGKNLKGVYRIPSLYIQMFYQYDDDQIRESINSVF